MCRFYLLPDRLLYNAIDTVKQTRTARKANIPKTEATTGTKTSVDLSSGKLLLVLLTPKFNNSILLFYIVISRNASEDNEISRSLYYYIAIPQAYRC